jgi:hypothetical protein
MKNKFFVSRTGALQQRLSVSFIAHQAAKLHYFLRGRNPTVKGYKVYSMEFLSKLVFNSELLNKFRLGQPLPAQYGIGLSERAIEYPWVLSKLSTSASTVLDAGSTLNFEYLLEHPSLREKQIVIYTLSPQGENKIVRSNVSYIYGDLRKTILQDNTFDEIVCVSTIEHVGMDNTFLYTKNNLYQEQRQNDYELVIKELRRLLKPNGRLLLTVPYGIFQYLGWLQQFDAAMIVKVIETFNPVDCRISYYKYDSLGWQLSTKEECATCEYIDLHTAKSLAKDRAVAARSVACIEFVK